MFCLSLGGRFLVKPEEIMSPTSEKRMNQQINYFFKLLAQNQQQSTKNRASKRTNNQIFFCLHNLCPTVLYHHNGTRINVFKQFSFNSRPRTLITLSLNTCTDYLKSHKILTNSPEYSLDLNL